MFGRCESGRKSLVLCVMYEYSRSTMDRHPFANPMHSYEHMMHDGYEGPSDPFANLQSFAPMASNDAFFRRDLARPLSPWPPIEIMYPETAEPSVAGCSNIQLRLRWRRAVKRFTSGANRSYQFLRTKWRASGL